MGMHLTFEKYSGNKGNKILFHKLLSTENYDLIRK